MFTVNERENLRQELLRFARADSRLSGGAIIGSAATKQLDEWSDIDLAFGVKANVTLGDVLKDFTKRMYEQHQALHHFDIPFGAWIYRVFLLTNTLQVDIAFAPEDQFGPLAPSFELAFGKTDSAVESHPQGLELIVGYCWLNAIHVRSALKRQRFWQAEHYLSGLRQQLIMLYCRLFRLPERNGRGVDQLPEHLRNGLQNSLVRSITPSELQRSFEVLNHLFLEELELHDKDLFRKLEGALREIGQ